MPATTGFSLSCAPPRETPNPHRLAAGGSEESLRWIDPPPCQLVLWYTASSSDQDPIEGRSRLCRSDRDRSGNTDVSTLKPDLARSTLCYARSCSPRRCCLICLGRQGSIVLVDASRKKDQKQARRSCSACMDHGWSSSLIS